MYVCICRAVTQHEVLHAIGRGARSVGDIMAETGAGNGCGSCRCVLKGMVERHCGGQTAAENTDETPDVAASTAA